MRGAALRRRVRTVMIGFPNPGAPERRPCESWAFAGYFLGGSAVGSRRLRRWGTLAGAAVLIATGAGPAAALPAPAEPAPPAPAGPRDGADERRVDVLITLRDQPSDPSTAREKANLRAQEKLVARWKTRFDLRPGRSFGYLVNGMSASVPLSRLTQLALEPEVASVRRERVYERTEHTARTLEGAPAAFAAAGLDGTGTVVSVIDSGMDISHRDLRLDDCGAAKITRVQREGAFTCKVPAGYDYADEDYDVQEPRRDSHGMHVAGIVGANGSEGDAPGDVAVTGRIDGVAPNAQLLAMKVFPDGEGGAADSDVVAAIEDSVKLGADVINMSLGSPNGQKRTSDATAMAIDAARDAGVVTVIAAGNEGQNFSPDGAADDAVGRLDDGTVDTPGTLGSALTVASLDNAVRTALLAHHGDPERSAPYEIATGAPDADSHPLVDIGLGDEAGIGGRSLDGAYALIERGEIDFAEKYDNAIAAGAGGVVIFNSAAGGEESFGMAGVEPYDLLGVVVPRSVGLELREEIAAGGSSIRLTRDVTAVPDPAGLRPSSFTSWGTTPTLDFEPEIAGIGGNVYSTFNDDTYGASSGTSMASPNVAGVTALVLEQLARTRPEVTGAARVDLARTLLMNTAQVPQAGNGVAASPRQVGAGLARADLAIGSTVSATVGGEAAAALREVRGSASFTVRLTNWGSAARTFSVPAGQQVLAETDDDQGRTQTRVSRGSLTPSTTRVVVPAGGTAEVTVRIAPERGADHFVGGWFELRAADAGQSDLRVPYLGFAGDWNAEPIVLAPGESLMDGLDLTTGLVSDGEDGVVPLSADPGRAWASPNWDGELDTVAPRLVLLRNASDLEYQLLDARGRALKTIGQEQTAWREPLGSYLGITTPGDLAWLGPNLDMSTWDPQAQDFQDLPDGRYTYRVRARLAEDRPWQQVDMPFGIDTAAPTIALGALENGVLSFTISETGSGLLEPPTVTTPGGLELTVTERGDGRYAVAVDTATVPAFTVSARDRAHNGAHASRILSDAGLLIDGADGLDGAVLTPADERIEDDALVVSGLVSPAVAAVQVGENEPVEIGGGRFRDLAPLVDGAQLIPVRALRADGTVLAEQTLRVAYDRTEPEIEIDPASLDGDGAVPLDSEGRAVLSGFVRDELSAANLTLLALVGADETEVPVGADGSFRAVLEPAADATDIVLAASDGGNYGVLVLPIAGRGAAVEGPEEPGEDEDVDPFWEPLEILNADCDIWLGVCFVPGDTEDISADGTILTLRGRALPGGRVTVRPGSRADDSGAIRDGEPISATVDDEASFALDVPVRTGENHMRITLADDAGKVLFEGPIRLFVDVNAPTLRMEEPLLIGGTLYTRTPEVEFRGTAADDGWGYTLMVNDSVVIQRMDRSSIGAQINERSFATRVRVADGDVILVIHRDANDNVLTGGIPVVLDTTAPAVELTGVEQGERVSDDRELAVTARDENLAAMTVTVDGEVVAQESTSLSTQIGPLEDALVDLRESGELDEGAEPEEVLAARTAPAQAELTASVPTAGLAPGEHVVVVSSSDLAGNRTSRAAVFHVVEPLAITGPDAVSLDITRDRLDDQAALAAEALAGQSVEGAQLALAPGTVLAEGEQKVTVVATAADGRRAEKEIALTITLKRITLTAGDVRATGTFRADERLSARWREEKGARVLELAGRAGFASVEAEISVPGAKGSRVLHLGADGTPMPLAVTWKDGRLTFTGPSHGTYRILPPKHGGGEGPSSPGSRPGDRPGSGPADRPGAGTDGGGGDGPRLGGPRGVGAADPAGRGTIARTGVELGGSLLAAALMVAAGTALAYGRTRRMDG